MPKNDEHIARIILEKPGTGNYLDEDMAYEIIDACGHIAADESAYVVLLTAAGDDFCTGGDKTPHSAVEALAVLDRPVVAAVNGTCSGPGLELALAADVRICSDDATFSLPQVADGVLPQDGGTQRLARAVGRGKALEMLLTAETLDAEQALAAGLVSHIYPAAELPAEAEKLAATIAAKGPLALRYLKEAVIKGMDMTLEQGLRLEADLYFLLHTTSDRTEGINSFLEKRDPEYNGE